MASEILINTGFGNGLLPDSTKRLPEPMLTNHKREMLKICIKITTTYPKCQWVKFRCCTHWCTPKSSRDNIKSTAIVSLKPDYLPHWRYEDIPLSRPMLSLYTTTNGVKSAPPSHTGWARFLLSCTQSSHRVMLASEPQTCWVAGL